jgi:uncharacterized protein YndB with AHSA1/START domain
MSHDLRFARVIAAPPDVVFAAFTEPRGQEVFYGWPDPDWVVRSECDLRVGGEWTIDFGRPPDELYRHRHVFRVIDPPRRIVLASTETRPDGSSFDTEVEFTFEDEAGKTLMTMLHTGFPTTELRDEHGSGLPTVFARFEQSIVQ